MSFLIALGLSSVAFAATNPPTVTFHKDVLPVLQRNCQSCHRPGEAAPMSFLTYEQTRPWAKAIKEAVQTRRMPPWFADPNHGKWANDRSLSQADLETLSTWADTGGKEGNAKDAPKPVQWFAGWGIGKPDMVLEMPNEFEVAGSGTVAYQYILIPTGLKEDKWVRMAEARPGNRQVVHHIIAFIREPGSKWMAEAQPGIPFVPKKQEQNQNRNSEGRPRDGDGFSGAEFLVGFAPGSPPEVFKPGRAKLLKAGSDIVLQMHYTASGKSGKDKSSIGLVWATEPPQQRVITAAASTTRFAIPAGASNHEVSATMTFHEDADAGWAAASHASAWQSFRVQAGLSDRGTRSHLEGARLSIRLAALVRVRRAESDSERRQDGSDRLVRQFGQQQVQPGPGERGPLGRTKLGRDDDGLF
ncbi:MAG: thiol-disulfide isomerase [Acidobacteria bacterium]|nr:thiol-disulfide isomerase [Acidobacteriota bacterium]